MKKGIKAKLMAATSLLLVSAILLSLTTYAWFILSTAPEVTEMQTTAGANGSLEIALQSGDTVSDINDIKNRVGDSSAVGSLKKANCTWGNVVDLSGDTYGLQGLSLLPARLNMKANGTVSKSSPLKMPLFGQDGRISELANLNSMRYDDTNKKYVDGQDKHGVLVYADDKSIANGTKDEKRLDRQGLIDTTREQIVKLRADLRADLVDTMDNNQAGISAILCNTVNLDLGIPESGNVYKYTKDDYGTITALLASFSSVQEKAARSVRHALLACAAADTTNYPVDTKTGVSEELSALYAKYLTLPMKSDGEADETVYSIATANKAKLSTGENSAQTSLSAAYDSVMQAAEATADVQRRVQAAQKSMIDNKRLTDLYKNENPTEADKVAFSQEISKSIQHLFDYRPESRAIYVTDETNEKKAPRTLWDEMSSRDKYYTYIKPKSEEPQTCFYMLKGSGLFSSLATIAGDYESGSLIGSRKRQGKTSYATTQIRSTVSAPPAENASVPYGETFGFSPENNTGCLQSVYAATSGLKAKGSVIYVITSVSRVNAYGYAVDLAFRSSEIGNLFLQQDAKDRVTGDAPANTPEGRLPSTSTTQGNGSTVEFWLRRSGQEYIEGSDSAMDRAKNLLQCLRVVFLKDAGEWTVLGVAAVDAKSINLSEADNGQTVKATAKLTLYSTVVVDGVLTLQDAKTDQSITQLGVNTPTAITALVYLDGDKVQNAFLTPDQPFSLSGSINLQFATDAKNLKPMEYTDFIIPKKSEDGEEGNGQ